MFHPVTNCPGPIARREFLRAGVLGLGGLTMPQLFQMRAAHAAATGQSEADTSVIFVWMPGGPPHMDMYDMKPDAPEEYRGAFRPIHTTVPGLDVCEHMPLHAKVAHKFNIVRSISHQFADHGGGHKRFMTGRDPKTPVDTVNDAPAVGSIVAKSREGRNAGIPNYVSLTDPGRDGVDVFAMGSAYLGPAYVPFSVPGDPSKADFKVPNIAPIAEVAGRLDNRTALLTQFDKFRREADQTGLMGSIDQFHEKAVGLLTSDKTKKAFDLSLEEQ